MRIGSKHRRPETQASMPDEPQDDLDAGGTEPEPEPEPDTITPLADPAAAADITAAADRHRQAAGLAQERSGQDAAEAERLRADARERAARIIAEAESVAGPLEEAARSAGDRSVQLAETARQLTALAGQAAKGEEAASQAAALEDESERLTARVAEVGAELERLEAAGQDVAARRAEARESGDLDDLASLIARATAIGERIADLRSTRDAAQARLAAIGTGEMLPTWPQKELAEARRQAGNHSVSRALDGIWPDRPEAIAAREREEWHLLLDAQAERIRDEQAAAGQPEGRTVTRGPQGQVVVRRG
jgi:hypothetical protein